MCGRFGIDAGSNEFKVLKADLGIISTIPSNNDIPPFSMPDIVIQREHAREVRKAIWSILIEPKPDGGYRALKAWKDNKPLKSFNALSSRLTKSPAWSPLYKHHRCIIPASYFYEWAPGNRCFKIGPTDEAIALGGLYKPIRFGQETVYGCTIVILPGHPKLQHIHNQSFPLMLRPSDYDAWLDPAQTDTDVFANWMATPIMRVPFQAQHVDSPRTLNPLAKAELFDAD